jgi:hypothetical protein
MMKQLEKALGNDGAGFKQFKFNLGGNMLEDKDLKLGISWDRFNEVCR